MPLYDQAGNPRWTVGVEQYLRSLLIDAGQDNVSTSNPLTPAGAIFSLPTVAQMQAYSSPTFDESDLYFGSHVQQVGLVRLYKIDTLWIWCGGGTVTIAGACGGVVDGCAVTQAYNASTPASTAGGTSILQVNLPVQLVGASSGIDPCGLAGAGAYQNVPVIYVATIALPPAAGRVAESEPEYCVGVGLWAPADTRGELSAFTDAALPSWCRYERNADSNGLADPPAHTVRPKGL
jgi:hypothetical protein